MAAADSYRPYGRCVKELIVATSVNRLDVLVTAESATQFTFPNRVDSSRAPVVVRVIVLDCVLMV